MLGKTIGLVGGIEPLHFLNLDLPGLRAYFEDLLERMDHRRWILANSDNWSVIAHCRSRRSCADGGICGEQAGEIASSLHADSAFEDGRQI